MHADGTQSRRRVFPNWFWRSADLLAKRLIFISLVMGIGLPELGRPTLGNVNAGAENSNFHTTLVKLICEKAVCSLFFWSLATWTQAFATNLETPSVGMTSNVARNRMHCGV